MKNKLLVLVALATMLVLVGCGTTTTIATTTGSGLTYHTYDYSEFSDMMLDDASRQLSMPEVDYYLYYYSTTCTGCNEIKQEMLGMIANLPDVTFYLVETTSYADVNENIHVAHTPSLVHVVQGEVELLVEGSSSVLAAMNDIG